MSIKTQGSKIYKYITNYDPESKNSLLRKIPKYIFKEIFSYIPPKKCFKIKEKYYFSDVENTGFYKENTPFDITYATKKLYVQNDKNCYSFFIILREKRTLKRFLIDNNWTIKQAIDDYIENKPFNTYRTKRKYIYTQVDYENINIEEVIRLLPKNDRKILSVNLLNARKIKGNIHILKINLFNMAKIDK